MNIITLDFETYYDREYSLSKMTTEEYIRDPRFQVVGVAARINDGPTKWCTGTYRQIKSFIDALPWDTHALLAHNTAFDGAILHWRLGVKPIVYFDTMSMANAVIGLQSGASLAALAEYYGLPPKGTAVINALGKRREDFSHIEMQEYADYCIHDVNLCYDIFQRMRTDFPKDELYVVDLTIRMFTEPRLVLDEKLLVEDLMNIRAAKRGSLLQLMNALGVKNEETLKKQLMSNDKFAELLKSRGIDPPTKVSAKTGKVAWAFAKTDEEFTDLGDSDDPLTATLVATRLENKSTINETRTESYANIAARGAYPFSLKYSGAKVSHRWCLTGDHEVLTPTGWVRLDEWTGGPIAQFDGQTKVISQLPATHNSWDVDEDLVIFNERHHQSMCTKEHKLATRAHHNDWVSPTTAGQMLQTKNRMMYVSGMVDTTEALYMDYQLQLMVAMHADGYNVQDSKNNMVRFRFTRPRKIMRLQQLLDTAAIPYECFNYPSEPQVVVIVIKGNDAPDWLRKAKTLPQAWLQLSARQIDVVLNEIPEWDGHKKYADSFTYTSTDRAAVDLYQTLAHLVGRRGFIGQLDRVEGWSPAYSLYVTNRDTACTGHALKTVNYNGKVYCPTTQTGYFLCRRNGTVFVTGNSGFDTNPQNLPRGSTLRKSIMAPPGCSLVVADLSNIELRLGMWLAGQQDAINDIVAGKDLYRVYAAEAFNLDYDSIAKDSVERFLAKECCLSLIYGTGAEKLKNTVRLRSKGKITIPMAEAERLKALYRNKNYYVVNAWEEAGRIIEWIYNNQCHTAFGFLPVMGQAGIIKPSGLALPYPGLTKTMGDKGMEWVYQQSKGRALVTDRVYPAKCFQRITQSLARDVMAEHAVKVAKNYWVAGIVHDELIVIVPNGHENQAKHDITQIMRTAPKWAVGLPLDCEVGVGKRYGDAK